MRLSLLLCGLVIIPSVAYAEETAPQPLDSAQRAVKRGADWVVSKLALAPRISEGKQSESSVKRQVDTIQHRLEREEQLLQHQLAQVAKMRATALKKEMQTLKKAEELERKAIEDYQRRIDRTIAAIETTSQPDASKGGQSERDSTSKG